MLRPSRFWLVLVPACLVMDRLLKSAALAGKTVSLSPGNLEFHLFRNSGIAFSLPFSGPPVWILSFAILFGVCLMAARDVKAKRFDRAGAYAFFLLGALSNLFDRIAFGFTVDYLIFFSRSAVNVADGMILAGALWLVFQEPLAEKKKAA
jgi:signal peptidase II